MDEGSLAVIEIPPVRKVIPDYVNRVITLVDLPVHEVNPNNRHLMISQKMLKALAEVVGANQDPKRLGGGTSKEVFQAGSEVLEIFNLQDPLVKQQAQAQSEFYTRNTFQRNFRRVTLPVNWLIKDASGEVVGMVQPFFGVPLLGFKD